MIDTFTGTDVYFAFYIQDELFNSKKNTKPPPNDL